MKRLKKGIIFYISIITLSVIIQSCCETNLRIIGSGHMVVSQLDNIRQDTINNEFRILLSLEVEFANNFNSLSIISSSYATSCDKIYVNNLKPESIELTCDKDFNFEGVLIEAGTNFLNKNKMLLDVKGGRIEILIKQEFLNDAEFSNETHEFKISVETIDEQKFTNTASTFLDM